MLTSTRASRLAKMPRRETQQQKVYDAENAAGLWGTAVGTTHAEVQAYVDKIANYDWFRRRWGAHRFHVETQRGVGGHGGYHTVAVGMNATGVHGHEKGAQRNVVLHEMAHTLAQDKDPHGNWHGPYFARTMLELVRYAIGAEQAKVLRESYKKHRVKLAPPTPLRAPERTPKPREIVTPKVWRVEFKKNGKTESLSYETGTMKGALHSVLSALERDPDASKVTNLRVWRGVRQAAKPAPRKKAAPRKRGQPTRQTVPHAERELEALVAAHGGTLDRQGDAYEALAPAGHVWAAESLEGLVGYFGGIGNSVPAAWKLEALNDLRERVLAQGGVVPRPAEA